MERLDMAPLVVGLEHFTSRAGGLNRYVEGLLSGLRAQGVAATVVALEDGRRDVAPDRVGVSGRGPLPLRVARVLRAVHAQEATTGITDVHFALHGLGAARRSGARPFVAHFHGPWAAESAVQGARPGVVRAKHLVEALVYRRASRVVVLSQAFRRLLVEDYGVDPWRVEVLAPGVDLDHFSPAAQNQARARLSVQADAWVTVCVRRLVPRMGHDVLLDAWAQLVDRHPHRRLRLLLAGTGPSEPALVAEAGRLGIASSVQWLGPVDEETLVDAYRAADVSVVPTVVLEGYGLVVLESLATGTPVVASDIGGIPDAMAGTAPDLLVPPGDAAALAGRLEAALTGERPLPSREACRRHAEQHSWPEVAARHVALYRDALDPPPVVRPRVVYIGHTAVLSGGELALARTLDGLRGSVDAHVILAEDGPLVTRLQRAGISVEVLAMPDAARSLRRRQVAPGRLPLRSLGGAVAYTVRLALRLRRIRPDVVHANTLKAGIYGGVAARAAGVPMVWHVRDVIDPSYLPAQAVHLVRILARWLPARVIANSKTTLKSLHLPAGRAVVIPSPVGGVPPAAARRGAELRVAIVGRLTPWKGQDVFLRAFAQAFPSGRERAVVVGAALFGEDGYAAGLQDLATELGIAGRVDFLGFRHDVEAVLAGVDVLVHASISPEPFGQVVVQGMAAGLAVVAAAAGGPRELISDGVDGLLCPPGDAGAYAVALRRLAGDPALRCRLGAAARGRVARFTAERVAAEMVAVYRTLMRT